MNIRDLIEIHQQKKKKYLYLILPSPNLRISK